MVNGQAEIEREVWSLSTRPCCRQAGAHRQTARAWGQGSGRGAPHLFHKVRPAVLDCPSDVHLGGGVCSTGGRHTEQEVGGQQRVVACVQMW